MGVAGSELRRRRRRLGIAMSATADCEGLQMKIQSFSISKFECTHKNDQKIPHPKGFRGSNIFNKMAKSSSRVSFSSDSFNFTNCLQPKPISSAKIYRPLDRSLHQTLISNSETNPFRPHAIEHTPVLFNALVFARIQQETCKEISNS
jgi:hypothetical protein